METHHGHGLARSAHAAASAPVRGLRLRADGSELKSGDMYVVDANAYADFRDELVPLDECARTSEVYD